MQSNYLSNCSLFSSVSHSYSFLAKSFKQFLILKDGQILFGFVCSDVPTWISWKKSKYAHMTLEYLRCSCSDWGEKKIRRLLFNSNQSRPNWIPSESADQKYFHSGMSSQIFKMTKEQLGWEGCDLDGEILGKSGGRRDYLVLFCIKYWIRWAI